MEISKDIKYIGVNDHITDLFEGQYIIPNGMAYNSYLIQDVKNAVMDSVDVRFSDAWLNNIESVLGNKAPDYLVVSHMEPDHSSSIIKFTEKYPNSKIVSSAKAFAMMKNFFGKEFSENRIIVSEGDKLSLGRHSLSFITAPMVHWPEVIMTFDGTEKVLFSADAFGKFGTTDTEEDWKCEARRYYFGIVGKFGANVQALLKKLSGCEIKTICPLHGPVLCENVSDYVELYGVWSSYAPEDEGVTIAYTTVYGNTEKAALILKDKLIEKGCKKVSIFNLAKDDVAEAVEDAFRYNKLVLATTTYNGSYFPFMRDFISHLTERNYQNRFIGFIENGSWAPVAAKLMKSEFEKCKDITFAENSVKILSAVNEENLRQIDALAEELVK